MKARQYILALAMKLIGVPYIWGGATPQGFDCSGFCIWILQVFGILSSGDWTAEGLSRCFRETAFPMPGDLVFYGQASDLITHVMIYAGVNTVMGEMVVGASGGDHTTTTIEAAKLKGAMVKMKPMDYRKDRIKIVDISLPKGDT